MASIKRLKKDIDYLTFAVIADCINYSVTSGKNDEKVSEIIEETVVFRNGLRSRIREAGKMDKKTRKEGFKAIVKDLFVNVDGAFSKLSGIVKQA